MDGWMDGWMDGTDGFEFKNGRCPTVPLSHCPAAVPLSIDRSIGTHGAARLIIQ